jgi:uncharacterized MAPEG superfamily protein
MPYGLLVAGLTLKFAWLIGLQGLRRMRTRSFRWAEDATHWQGHISGEDVLVERAQAALRNDGESQPLFLAAAGLWIALGAGSSVALVVCSVYLLARVLHSVFMLWPRQPVRNRVFGISQLCLLAVLVDSARLLLVR